MGKKNISQDKEPWALAMKKYRLNVRQIAMAKELGMNPKKKDAILSDSRDRNQLGAKNEGQSW